MKRDAVAFFYAHAGYGCAPDETAEAERTRHAKLLARTEQRAYAGAMICESHMQAYAQETAEDCGLLNKESSWPYTCIDWEQATREFTMDYSAVEFEGVTYYVR